MLEFLALFYLVKKNRENALARGRKPGGFIALTFILWFHFELAGLIFGVVRGYESFLAMLIGVAFAAVGGLISWLCAKFVPQGDYVAPIPKSTMNTTHNGAPAYNTPGTYNSYPQYGQPQQFPIDPATGAPVVIDPATGEPVETKVDPVTGLPLQDYLDPVTGAPIQAFVPSPEARAKAAEARYAPPQTVQAQPEPSTEVNYCYNCGTPVAPGSNFCNSCGARLN